MKTVTMCPPGIPCEPLDVDGRIKDLEYVNASRSPLQDFASGNPTGKLWILQGSPERLNVALRVWRGDSCTAGGFAPDGCGLWNTVILLDARREDTLTNLQAATQVREDDRAILLTHHTAKHFDVQYFRGLGGQWVPANGNERWPAIIVTQPNGPWLEIEMEILLRPAGSSLPSEVLGNGKMGLGAFHFRYSPPGFFTMHYWPGNAGIDPIFQLVNAPNYFIPYTWATIEFARPDPVPLSLMTYNIGLVPIVANGGSGDVVQFAAIAASVGGPEVMCFQEVWNHDERRELAEISDFLWKSQFPGDESQEIQEAGAPQECGGLTDPFCNPEELLMPGYGGTGLTVADTRLLVLSKNPIFAAEVREFSEGLCAGADCLEAKGAIWTRVGTAAARKVIGENSDKVVYDAEEYVDVFCTHAQAHCDDLLELAEIVIGLAVGVIPGGYFLLEYISLCDEDSVLDVQSDQFAELRAFIDEKAQPSDRPAFVLGDFNAHGGEAHLGFDSAYGQALGALGLLNLAPFDAANQLFSKRYDLALGCRDSLPYAVPPVVPTAFCNPLLTPDVFQYAANMPAGQPKWPRLGVGTNISNTVFCDAALYGTAGDVDSNRYDHVFVYPARPPEGELPLFAITNTPEPHVMVNTYPDPNNVGECFSDHKAVTAYVDLVRLEDKLSFNPNMRHEIRYNVNRVENLTGDASGGAEFYSRLWFTDGNTLKQKNYGVFKDDSDVIYPNWNVKAFAEGFETLTFDFKLFEEDWGANPDDYYAVVPWHNGDVWSVFLHHTSQWVLRDLGGFTMDTFCFERLHQDCLYDTIGSMNVTVKHEGTAAGSERARIMHGLTAVEAPL